MIVDPNMHPRIPSQLGEPAWEVTQFFPPQGQWRESDFLRIHTNKMAELVNGRLEILPMPTWRHQCIVKQISLALQAYITERQLGGEVLFAPLPSPLFPGTIREPDILYVRPENIPSDIVDYPDQLDLVMEIVSEGSEARKRDYVDKRLDYARAGITEYWIVDPEFTRITVLSLEGNDYRVHCECNAGDTAHSAMFADFTIAVDDVFKLS
ncbi:MAG: Uma2 family endonuclease [Pirellulaceae bacterium]|nr:Uma2 family endonuclease [Pirellulaceae bacterium]